MRVGNSKFRAGDSFPDELAEASGRSKGAEREILERAPRVIAIHVRGRERVSEGRSSENERLHTVAWLY